jgi:hypothetical protein
MRKVYVSPTYHGNGWYDPKAGMNFFKRDGIITIPDGVNTVNIDRYITLNYLVEVKEEEPVEATVAPSVPTAKKLLSEDIKVEPKEVPQATTEVIEGTEVVEPEDKKEEPVNDTPVTEELEPKEEVKKTTTKKAP